MTGFAISTTPLVVDEDGYATVLEPGGENVSHKLGAGMAMAAWVLPELGGAVVYLVAGSKPDPDEIADAALFSITAAGLDRLIADLGTIRAALDGNDGRAA